MKKAITSLLSSNFLKNRILSYCIVLFIVLLSTLTIWLPYLSKTSSWMGVSIPASDFKYVYGNFDGPLYIIAAKTGYDPAKIDIPGKGLIISLPLTAQYFAAHLPIYPLFISIGAHLFGYLKSLVFVNVFFTAFLALFFYYMVKKLKVTEHPLLLTIVLLHLPRFMVVRSVGAPESLFMLLVLGSLFFFERKQYLVAGLLGAISVATKVPGILLFAAYFLVFAEMYYKTRKFEWKWLWILLIPAGLLAVFTFYYTRYNDFFVFFHTGGVVPMGLPFSQFNFQGKWIGTPWLEDILAYFLIYGYGVILLWKSKYRSFFYFGAVFLLATTLVQHRDIARYTLPIWPLVLIAYEKTITSKKFFILFILLLPALYLFTWNFITANVMPIGDWTPFE